MPKRVAFITGIAGFAGSWLAEELLAHGWTVAGSLYANEPTENLAGCDDNVKLVPLDILKPDQVRRQLKKVGPTHIFHLAALAAVGKSFEAERATYDVNFMGTFNVLQAAGELSGLKKVVFVSSSDAYGLAPKAGKTLTEDSPLAPVSPYGISKASAEFLCVSQFRRGGLPVTVARSFNHSGPRQAENFVIPDFARQVAAIESGLQEPVMKTGNLTPRRDFSDVRDIVRGYRLMAEKGAPGRVYQLCSGKVVAVEKVLSMLTSLSSREIAVTMDPKKKRTVEIPVIRGSNKRAVEELGYEVRYRLKQTIRETYEYWIGRLSEEKIKE